MFPSWPATTESEKVGIVVFKSDCLASAERLGACRYGNTAVRGMRGPVAEGLSDRGAVSVAWITGRADGLGCPLGFPAGRALAPAATAADIVKATTTATPAAARPIRLAPVRFWAEAPGGCHDLTACP